MRYCTLMVWRCSIPSQDKTPCASLAACSLSRWSSCCAYAFPGFRCSHRTKKVSQVIPWFHKKCDIIDLVFRKGGRVHHMNKSILVFWGWYFRCTYQLSPSLGVAVSQKKTPQARPSPWHQESSSHPLTEQRETKPLWHSNILISLKGTFYWIIIIIPI